MKQQETTATRSNVRKTLLAVAALFFISAGGAMAQGNLGYLVSDAGFDWVIGKWEATNDEGDKVELEYKWELNKNMISMQLKWPNFEYRGIIFYMPAKEEVVQIGVDNGGGNGKGRWEPVGNKAVLKYEHAGLYGETTRMGLAHSKVDAKTIKVEVYELDSDGNLAEEPGFTMEYKRQQPQSGEKKDSAKTP
jgi:hypothetical protein